MLHINIHKYINKQFIDLGL